MHSVTQLEFGGIYTLACPYLRWVDTCVAPPQDEFYHITGSSLPKPLLITKYISKFPEKKRWEVGLEWAIILKIQIILLHPSFYNSLFNHWSPNHGQSNCTWEKKKSMRVSASVAKKLHRSLPKFILLCKSLHPWRQSGRINVLVQGPRKASRM